MQLTESFQRKGIPKNKELLEETSPKHDLPFCISSLHLPTTSHYSNHSFIIPNASNMYIFCFCYTQKKNKELFTEILPVELGKRTEV